MEQKVEPLSTDDSARLEKQRAWVRDHYDPGARHQYDTLEGKLRLVETILRENWIDATETWKLQSLGVAFGDALAEKMGLVWVAVEDEHGRDPALHDCGRTLVLFPLTMISKRVERGEEVNVREMFAGMCAEITRLRSDLPRRTTH
jgi:Domain of unknown function (DUF3806)